MMTHDTNSSSPQDLPFMVIDLVVLFQLFFCTGACTLALITGPS